MNLRSLINDHVIPIEDARYLYAFKKIYIGILLFGGRWKKKKWNLVLIVLNEFDH